MRHIPQHLKKNYSILAPVNTHWRPATCEEVQCRGFANGFETSVDERDLTPLGGRDRGQFIRKVSGRRFSATRNRDGITVFRFPPGQRCWNAGEHKIRIDRPELFVVKDLGVVTRHEGAEGGAQNWVDDFANHQDKLAKAIKEG